MNILSLFILIFVCSCSRVDVPDSTRKITAEDFYKKGIKSLNEKDYENASNYFDKALELKPNWSDAVIKKRIADESKTNIVTFIPGEDIYQEMITSGNFDDDTLVQYSYYLVRKKNYQKALNIADMIQSINAKRETILHIKNNSPKDN